MNTKNKITNKMYRIAFCGIDGAGKTSLITKLHAYYQNHGIATEIAKVNFKCKETCNSIFQEGSNEEESTLIKRIAMAFDYVNYYSNISNCYDLLLCDRYDVCYKVLHKVDNLPPNIIKQLNKIYTSIIEPDMYVFLDVSIQTASFRLNARGNRSNDENDYTLDLMRKYYYEELHTKKNVIFLDAEQSQEELFKITLSMIEQYTKGGQL